MDTFSQTKMQSHFVDYLSQIEAEKIEPSKPESEIIFESKLESFPAFSIIMRTQGKRIPLMEQSIVSLLAQEVQDFELVVVAHNAEKDALEKIKGLIEDFGPQLENRVSFISVEGGLRGVPMNVGINSSKGDYVAFLDDDDLVFAHWLSAFQECIKDNLGKIVRSRCVDRFVSNDENEAIPSYVLSGLEDVRSSTFSFTSHFFISQTVLHQYATPREKIIEGKSFVDESLPVVEDWDFLLRNAELLGVADTGQITGIYNRWVNKGSSLHDFDPGTWSDYHRQIFMRFNERGVYIQPGELLDIYKLWMTQERFKEFAGDVLIDGDHLTINKKLNAMSRTIQYYEHQQSSVAQLSRKQLIKQCANAFLPNVVRKVLKSFYRKAKGLI